MLLGTTSENFRSLQRKLCPWHAFEVHASSTYMVHLIFFVLKKKVQEHDLYENQNSPSF